MTGAPQPLAAATATIAVASLPALTVTRAAPPEAASPPVLGVLALGAPPGDDEDVGVAGVVAGVAATVLQGPAGAGRPVLERWHTTGTVQRGRHARVRWAADGQWLWGALECDDCAPRDAAADGAASGLADRVEAAYREVFACLRQAGYPHLLRIWNHLPQINADEHGLERYRHFNLGRLRAMSEAGQPAFEGAPAACALGTHRGPLGIRFLAARHASVAIENPRQLPAYRYPSDYGPASPNFSRAALCDAGGGQLALLVSGTASIVGHATVHPGDVDRQLDETLLNLQAVIDTARRHGSARFELADSHCTINVRHAGHLDRLRAGFERAVGAHSRAAREAVYLHTDICRSDLLVEIEAHLWAGGRLVGA